MRLELHFTDPQLRNELFWKKTQINDKQDLVNLAFRPICMEIPGKDRQIKKSLRTGIIVSSCQDGVCLLLGFRTLPIHEMNIHKLCLSGNKTCDIGERKIELPILRLRKTEFARIFGFNDPHLLVPQKPNISSKENSILENIGKPHIEKESVTIWLPYSDPNIKLRLLEYPNNLALITRELGNQGKLIIKPKLVPYHDHLIGRLMERSGSAHLEEIKRMKIGKKLIPVRQFFLRPTARLEFSQIVDSGNLTIQDSISVNTLESARLLCFALARELEKDPKTKNVLKIGVNPERLVLLDQGGTTGPVVGTEPRKWKARSRGSTISNELRYLTMITFQGTTYHMRSEAVADYNAGEWKTKDRFRMNDLLFAGQKPILEIGKTALFTKQRGQPEKIRTYTGTRLQVTVEPRTSRLNVYITHLEEKKNGDLYIDGFRSMDSFTAVPINQIDPTHLIRGGRLRWRPKAIQQRQLTEHIDFPIVYQDQTGTVNVAITRIPQRSIYTPAINEGFAANSLLTE
jgi:hypothetical protein